MANMGKPRVPEGWEDEPELSEYHDEVTRYLVSVERTLAMKIYQLSQRVVTLEEGGASLTPVGTTNRITVDTASVPGQAIFSTPQALNTAAEIVFKSVKAINLQPVDNLPAMQVLAGASVVGTITQQPSTPLCGAALFTTPVSNANLIDGMRFTYPSTLPGNATDGDSIPGLALILNQATGLLVGCAFPFRQSATVMAFSPLGTLANNTDYLFAYFMMPV